MSIDLKLPFSVFLRLSLKEYRATTLRGAPWPTDSNKLLDEQVERCLEAWLRFRKKRKVAMSDGDWYAGLAQDFPGVDVATQRTLAMNWAKRNERKFTRRFFENWLQKELKSVLASSTPGALPAPQISRPEDIEPPRWQERLKKLAPEWPGHTDWRSQLSWQQMPTFDRSTIIEFLKSK